MTATAPKSAVFGATIPDFPSVILDLDDGPLGQPSLEVVASVRRLLNFSFGEAGFEAVPIEEFDVEARRAYDRLNSTRVGSTDALAFLLYLSTYFHEIRHAHDLLSTYYGQEILGRHLNLFQNSDAILQMLFAWQATSNTPVPLPLRPDIPGLGNQLTGLLERQKQLAEDVTAYRDRRAAGINIEQVLEASAVNAQMGFVYDTFGDTAVDALHDFMSSSGRGGLYFSIHAEFVGLWQKFGSHSGGGGVLGYLLWSSLNPPVKVNGSAAAAPHPAEVLETMMKFAGHLAKGTTSPTVRDIQRELSGVHRAVGVETLEQSTNRIRSVQQHRYDALRKLRDSASVRSLAAAIEGFDTLRSIIEHTPEVYFNPQAYPWAILRGHLPAVVVRVRFQGEIYDNVSKGQLFGEVADAISTANDAATYRLLVSGRDSSSPRWLEDLLFDVLTSGDQPLRFQDDFFSM